MTSPSEETAPAHPLVTDEVYVVVPGSNILQGPPRATFTHAVADFAKAVLKEASNLESEERANGTKQREFHSKHIERAVGWVRDRGAVTRPRTKWYLIGRIAQALFVVFSGLALTWATAPKAWVGWGYILTGSLVFTLVLTVFIEVSDWRDHK